MLFGLAHDGSFFAAPVMERSDSLLAPIVAHGVGNFVEVALALARLAASGTTG